MDNFDEVLGGPAGRGRDGSWMLERMAHSKACWLCGTPTAPSDLIERQGADETLTRMGAGVGQVGDGTGRLAVQVEAQGGDNPGR